MKLLNTVYTYTYVLYTIFFTPLLITPAVLAEVLSQPKPAEIKDQLGMGRNLGTETWGRCAALLQVPQAKIYELSHERTNEMPQARFAEHEVYTYDNTQGIPNTRHGFNTESVRGNIGGQGTQIDALGHFGYLPEIWDGKNNFPAEKLEYYGGWKQKELKSSPHSPLQALGVDHIPPIVTSAILLDAARFLNHGEILENNEIISAQDILGMLKAQGLEKRGLLPGDAVLIHTGWGRHWNNSKRKSDYYTRGPGLSYDAALFLQEKNIVLVALDNPFTDPAPEGMLTGKTQPAGTPKGLPFAIHHQNLSQSGIYQVQNTKLDELSKDQVWSSCIMILPLKIQGAGQSPVRPVAIGTPSFK